MTKNCAATGLLVIHALTLTSFASPSALVTVVALSITGEEVTSATVELLDARSDNNGVTFKNLQGKNISYGTYVLRVRANGFKTYEQYLYVYQPHVYARVRLTVSRTIDEAPWRLTGVVKGILPGTPELWVKLYPVIGGTPVLEDKVDERHRFELSGMEPGDYLLAVFRGRQCIHFRQVDSSNDNVEVVIDKGP